MNRAVVCDKQFVSVRITESAIITNRPCCVLGLRASFKQLLSIWLVSYDGAVLGGYFYLVSEWNNYPYYKCLTAELYIWYDIDDNELIIGATLGDPSDIIYYRSGTKVIGAYHGDVLVLAAQVFGNINPQGIISIYNGSSINDVVKIVLLSNEFYSKFISFNSPVYMSKGLYINLNCSGIILDIDYKLV
jgi:hypothetical protein